MGLYATTTSLETLMIGTTFDSITTALASKLITHAENEINKYISKRYDISNFNTSTSIPPIITSICETLAEGYIYQRDSRGGGNSQERGQKLIDQAIKNLELIKNYELDLIDSSGDVVTDLSNTSYSLECNTKNYSTTFNEDDELNWEIDQDKLDDIDTERG